MNAIRQHKKSFLIRLDYRTWGRLKSLSEREDAPISYFMRRFLREGLDNVDSENQQHGKH